MKRTTIDLSDDLTLQLKLYAVQNGKTLKQVITQAIEEFLKQEEPKMKKYVIKEEYRLNWSDCGGLDLHNDNDWIVTDKDIEDLAIGWGKEKAELMEQVEEA